MVSIQFSPTGQLFAYARSDATLVMARNPFACPTDVDGDGVTGRFDLAFVLGFWGPNPGHPADLDGDGVVGPFDLALVLGFWGPCP